MVKSLREHISVVEGTLLTEGSSYQRVLPRDLFNEAGLLKCYGKLWILTERMQNAGFAEEDVSNFNIGMDENSGGITVTNLHFMVNGKYYPLFRPMNSRRSWPLFLMDEETYEEVEVFDEGGGFTAEMKAFLSQAGEEME